MILALDAQARQEVFERDGFKCQRCGVREGLGAVLQWSHVHSRRHYCLRWDPDNAKILCLKCHCWWTNNPGLAYDWFVKKFPERWERITRVLQANPKVRVKELYEGLKA
jgi:5-methylcytosine-specific restriction endonuclease McrA